MKKSDQFGLTLSNIPIANLRWEFNSHRRLIADPAFRAHVRYSGEPIETPEMVWLGVPGAFLTLLVVRAILGIESYLPFAVIEEAAARGLPLKDLSHKTRHPLSLSRKLPEALYNRLPALVDPTCALRKKQPSLYPKVEVFYTEVRNALLHGYEVSVEDVDQVHGVFEMMAAVYEWLDEWSPPENWTVDPRTKKRVFPKLT